MNISIEDITNGWLLYTPKDDDGCSNRTAFTHVEGFTDTSDRKEMVMAAQRLLMHIADEMGLHDKFSEFNIQVNIVEGHKFDKE